MGREHRRPEKRATARAINAPANVDLDLKPGLLQELPLEAIDLGDVVLYRRGAQIWPAHVVAIHPDEVLDLVVLHPPRHGGPSGVSCVTFAGRIRPWRRDLSPAEAGWDRRSGAR